MESHGKSGEKPSKTQPRLQKRTPRRDRRNILQHIRVVMGLHVAGQKLVGAKDHIEPFRA